MLAQEKQTVDRLMYRISHDLGAAARALVELPQWIIEDLDEAGTDIPDDVAENLQLLRSNARRLDQMLRDLLEYSRVGRFQTFEKIDLDAIVAQVVRDCPLPDGFALDLTQPEAPFAAAQPDFSRIIRALLTNAIRHHDRTTGRLALSVTTDSGWITITMTDDGPGIPAPNRADAVDLMKTLRPRDQVEGSGMGLAIVEQITKLNGGSLALTDAPQGRGLQACVRLKRGAMLTLSHSDKIEVGNVSTR